MSFKQFIAFAAVAKHRSITKAAQALTVSQPSISKHLKLLEDKYKVKLFSRESGHVELTEDGVVLLKDVEIVLSRLEKIDRRFKRGSPSQKKHALKIAGSYAASAVLLPALIALFKKKHPAVPIVLRTGSTQNVKGMLLNSEVEVALLNEIPSDSNLSGEAFREEKLAIFTTPNHPLTKKNGLSLSDFNDATLVATGGKGRRSTTEKILNQLSDQGLTAKISIRCGTPESVKAIVKKGIGLGMLFEDTVMPEIRKKIFRRLNCRGVKLAGRSYIVYSNNRPLSPEAREFLTLLRKKAVKDLN